MINIDDLTISVMTIEDLNEIKDSLIEDFSDLWNYEIFKDELEHNKFGYLVLRYNDEIIGYGGIKIIVDEAELMDIVIRKDMRR